MVLITKQKKISLDKSSRGYRLKTSTHRLIDKIQLMISADQDTVITRACKLLYKELKTLENKNRI